MIPVNNLKFIGMELLVHMTKEDFRNDLKNIVSETIRENHKPEQPTSREPEYLTRQETARKFKISLVTLHRWTKAGIVKDYKIGGRVLYRVEEIENAISENHKKYRR